MSPDMPPNTESRTDATLVGIEIGGTKLQVALGAPDGAIVARRRGTVDRDAGAAGILEWTMSQTAELLETEATEQPTAIGIGFGGPVDSETGQALVSHQIAGWDNQPIRRRFEKRFGLPVVVANDANAAGWAEYRLGAGRGTRQFMYMNIGSGIGGALVVDGRLYDGQGLGACEIGHTWVPDWTSAQPGTANKLENLCSGWAIEKRLRQSEALRDLSDCAALGKAARQGRPEALVEIARVAESVAIALCNAIALFHPERIALGGGVSLMGETLLAPVREALNRHVFAPYRDTVSIVPCALAEDVVVAGVLLLAGELADVG